MKNGVFEHLSSSAARFTLGAADSELGRSCLFIEGALWNRAKAALDEPRRRELHAPFPMLAMKPQRVAPPPSAGVYVCPVYKTIPARGTQRTLSFL